MTEHTPIPERIPDQPKAKLPVWYVVTGLRRSDDEPDWLISPDINRIHKMAAERLTVAHIFTLDPCAKAPAILDTKSPDVTNAMQTGTAIHLAAAKVPPTLDVATWVEAFAQRCKLHCGLLHDVGAIAESAIADAIAESTAPAADSPPQLDMASTEGMVNVPAGASAGVPDGLTKNEEAAATFRAKVRESMPPEGTIDALKTSAAMLDQYSKDCYPANESGQVHFVRAIMEAAADEIRAYVARPELAPSPAKPAAEDAGEFREKLAASLAYTKHLESLRQDVNKHIMKRNAQLQEEIKDCKRRILNIICRPRPPRADV